MRKLLIIFIVPLLFSCNSEPQTGALLTGSVENLETGFFLMGGPGGSRDSIFTDDEGKFSFELPELKEPYLYYFMSEEEIFRFYFAPGMNLDVSFDQNNFNESMLFAGKGSDINNYIADKIRVFGDRMDDEVYKKEPEEFRLFADAQLEDQLAMLNEIQKNDNNDPYWLMEEGDIIFTYANNHSSYSYMHKYYAELEEFELPESFNDYKQKLDVNQGKYIKSRAFTSYVASYIREMSNKKSKEYKEDNPDAELPKIMNLELASEILTDTLVLNNFLFNNVNGSMQWQDLEDIQEQIEYFKSNCKDADLITKFNEEYEAWKKLAKGQPGMDFVGIDLEGNKVSFSHRCLAVKKGLFYGVISQLKKLEYEVEETNSCFDSDFYNLDV